MSRISLLGLKESFIRLDKRIGGRLGYLEITILLIAVSVGFFIRILPSRWGFLLSEFDPWWHFKVAETIVERGWAGFFEFPRIVITKSWYPTGIQIGKVFYPGVSFTLAFIYLSLSSLGFHVNMLELASLLPPIYGALAIVVTFLLARHVIGTKGALASALLLAVSAANISRTHLGWFDDEALSIPLMHGAYLSYLVAIDNKRSLKGALFYGLLSGFLLGYMSASWGAHKFPLMLVPLFTGILTFIGRYTRRLLVAYIATVITYTLIAINVPKLGYSYLGEITMISGIVILGYLIFTEFCNRYLSPDNRILAVRGGAVLAVVFILIMTALGNIGIPGLKFFSVLAPWLRGELPIVQSVAENQTATWATIFQDFGPTIILVPFGIYLLIKKKSDGAIFLLIYALLSLYFASSLVRLALPVSPLVAILAGYSLSTMFESGSRMLVVRGVKRRAGPSSAIIVVPIILMIIISIYYMPQGLGNPIPLSSIDLSYVPATILTSSLPTKSPINDWARAVEWMRNNLPDNAVVAAWWDYGNWISIVGNKTSIIDNTTIDSKRIAKIGYAFMSPENVSYRIFKEMGATHVLIFVTHRPPYGEYPGQFLYYGDESKWYWMLKIANQEASALGYPSIDENSLLGPGGDPTNPTEKFWTDTTLGQLIPFKPQSVTIGTSLTYAHVYEEPKLTHYKLVYSSSSPYSSIAYVYIYEIID
ncbi:MAG: STT3 domain-containing protein [Nitrososphaerota archaeon]